jgi:saccharopine dehydrogenase-like NADP-dependent oxidoreductase
VLYGSGVRFELADATRPKELAALMEWGPDVAVDLLPVRCHDAVCAAALEEGVHMVNASYASPAISAMSAEAERKGLTILPEFGMDPGIDLVLMGRAVRSLDRVEEIVTYGAGFPEPCAADNPIRYKVTWSFEGVMRSYCRPARVIRDGEIFEIGARELFHDENCHDVELPGLGTLEAFPNGDATEYVRLLGIDTSTIKRAGRYVLRWPGHRAFWRPLVELGLLDEEPLIMDGVPVDRRRYLAGLIEPRIQYRSGERDVVVVRVEVAGLKAGRPKRGVLQLIDRRDLDTGITAMGRTVGFTASIGAQMIGSGEITARGVLSPLTDVPFEAFRRELERRNISVVGLSE